MAEKPQRIGELNGPYSWLLRAALWLMPFALAWGASLSAQLWGLKDTMNDIAIWVAATEANRFTALDWQRERKGIMAEIPGRWVTDKLASIELEQRRQQVSIDRIEAALQGRPYDGRGYADDE